MKRNLDGKEFITPLQENRLKIIIVNYKITSINCCQGAFEINFQYLPKIIEPQLGISPGYGQKSVPSGISIESIPNKPYSTIDIEAVRMRENENGEKEVVDDYGVVRLGQKLLLLVRGDFK